MTCKFTHVLLAAALLGVSAGRASAWGRGGVAVGGYRGGVAAGGYRAPAVGGYRAGGVGAVGGFHGNAVGVHGAGVAGGYRVGGVGGVGVHAPLATDFGFGHVAGGVRGYGTVRHYTTPYTGGMLAARGAAVRGGFGQYGAYNAGWWGRHPGAWRPYGWNVGNAWGWATWPALAGWFAWSAPPIFYDFGNTIVYQGDDVLLDGQPVATADQYYQQAANLAVSAPIAPPPAAKDDAWQPLGVFALVQAEQSDPTAIFQLAVNKAGVIRGNYYNVLTDSNLPVRGAVDPKTQRASWIVGDQKTTVYDTGIVNLTKDESPLLIHFGKERTQQWLLVRVKDQDAQGPPPAVKPSDTPPMPGGGTTAKIVVVVPTEAEVFFDGVLMKQAGPERTFHTPPLLPGQSYSYTVRARWTQDGMPVEQTRTVSFKAGASVRVNFNPGP